MRQGKKFEFANGDVTLHPLTLGQLQDHEEDLADLKSGSSQMESNARLCRIVAAAAKKSQPDITEQEVLDMIDLQDLHTGVLNQAVQWVMGMSALRPIVAGAEGTRPDPPSPQ